MLSFKGAVYYVHTWMDQVSGTLSYINAYDFYHVNVYSFFSGLSVIDQHSDQQKKSQASNYHLN